MSTTPKWNFNYGWNALCAFENETGMSTIDGGTLKKVLRSTKALRAFVWAGLLHAEPDLTLEQAGERLSLANINDVIDQCSDAYLAASKTPDAR